MQSLMLVCGGSGGMDDSVGFLFFFLNLGLQED